MKVLLLMLTLSVIGCASNSNKKMEEKVKTEAAKEVAKAEVKKEAVKKMAPKKEAAKFGKNVTCTYGETERMIQNQSASTGGCEVFYTKEGVEDSVASAQNDIDYCQEIVDRIANKLTAAGYKCSDEKSSEKMQ